MLVCGTKAAAEVKDGIIVFQWQISQQGIQFTPGRHGYPVGRIHGIPDRLPSIDLHNAVK